MHMEGNDVCINMSSGSGKSISVMLSCRGRSTCCVTNLIGAHNFVRHETTSSQTHFSHVYAIMLA